MLVFLNKKVIKKLKIVRKNKSGRNYSGRIVVRHKGGNVQKNDRLIDNFRKISTKIFLIKITNFTKSSAYIGLVYYDIGLFCKILLENTLKIGSIFYNYTKNMEKKYRKGNVDFLKNINLGQSLFNIELKVNEGFKLAKSAGTFAVLYGKSQGKVTVKLNSGWLINLSEYCSGVIGRVSNEQKKMEIIGKAGINRKRGKRPTVRGVAMNPVDHPHGGGEGKKNPKRAKTPWGVLTKGYLTKRKKKFLLKKKKFKIKTK